MGLFMLAGSVVREPGRSLDNQDWGQVGGAEYARALYIAGP